MTSSKAHSRRGLWPGLAFLLLLCAVFYGALYHYADMAQAGQRAPAISAGFCLAFCVLLGSVGFRVTRRLWTAATVHTLAAGVLLLHDVPPEALLQDSELTLTLLAAVFGLTLAASWGASLTGKRRTGRAC